MAVHAEPRARAWVLRDAVSAYDAAHVALAEALDCPLVTRDARLARSSGDSAVVEVPWASRCPGRRGARS